MISQLLLPVLSTRIDLTTVLRDVEVFLERYTDKQKFGMASSVSKHKML